MACLSPWRKRYHGLSHRKRVGLHTCMVVTVLVVIVVTVLAIVLGRKQPEKDPDYFTGTFPAARSASVLSGNQISFDFVKLNLIPTSSSSASSQKGACAPTLLDAALVRMGGRVGRVLGVNIHDQSKAGTAQKPVTLTVQVTNPVACDWTLDSDESYKLSISNVTRDISLVAPSPLGALRGIMSLSQLITTCPGQAVAPTQLCLPESVTMDDSPSYRHRGLMLDSGRIFIPAAQILRHLDSMEVVKLNTFHWHVIDAQSVPLPFGRMINGEGAFNDTNGRPQVYTETDIKQVIQYAYDRGIRVVPEFDFPGHADVWARTYPEILSCNPDPTGLKPSGQINPFSPDTYSVLGAFFQAQLPLFATNTDVLHVGLDEVNCDCWATASGAPAAYNCADAFGKVASFLHNQASSNNKRSMLWADPLTDHNLRGNVVPKNSIVQIWKDAADVDKILKNHPDLEVVVSLISPWYFDCGKYCNSGKQLTPAYVIANQHLPKDPRVLGGEAVLFTEDLSDVASVESIVWPRAAAVAEALWSRTSQDHLVTYDRMDKIRAQIIANSGIVAASTDAVWK